MLDGLADLHSHILPGVDDGPPDLDGSLALLHLLVRDGVTTVAATPHIHPEFPRGRAHRRRAFSALREAAERAGIPIELVLGAELDIHEVLAMTDEELTAFAFGSGNVVLIEFPWVARWPEALPDAVDRAHSLDLRPIVAHPERIDVWSHDLDLITDLRERGAAIQLTAGSVLGQFGRRELALSMMLLEDDLVDLLASDAHGSHRTPRLSEARELLARRLGDEVASDLVLHGPRRLLEGGSVPSRSGR